MPSDTGAGAAAAGLVPANAFKLAHAANAKADFVTIEVVLVVFMSCVGCFFFRVPKPRIPGCRTRETH